MSHQDGFAVRHVICPIDFSRVSLWALRYAGCAARTFGSRLTIVHSRGFELPAYFTGAEEARLNREIDTLKAELQHRLEAVVREQIGKAWADLSVDYRVFQRRPEAAILSLVEKEEGDLVVMATHGRSGWNRLWLGSTTERVLQLSPVPVFTVRGKEEVIEGLDWDMLGEACIDRILAPVDGEAKSVPVVQAACALAARLGAELLFLGVSAPGHPLKTPVRDWLSRHTTAGCRYQFVHMEGDRAEVIVQEAEASGADLIVIGGHRRTDGEGLFFGRTTERVVRRAGCGVMTIPLPL